MTPRLATILGALAVLLVASLREGAVTVPGRSSVSVRPETGAGEAWR
jgi:hypothetical protein